MVRTKDNLMNKSPSMDDGGMNSSFPSKRNYGLWKWFAYALFACLILVSVGYYYVVYHPVSLRATKKNEYIKIPRNADLTTITGILTTKGIIDKPKIFYVLGRILSFNTDFKRGYYLFKDNLSWWDLINILQNGYTATYKFTLFEGWNSFQIFKTLRASPLRNKGEYEKYFHDPSLLSIANFPNTQGLEGFLFPDTYLFLIDAKEIDILKRMVNNFKSKLPEDFKKAASRFEITPYKLLILASIIEKETAHDKDALLISSVFHNRLRINMRLQTDPTVIYGTKKFNSPITKSDLRKFTPYNTYKINGLPPTPIANPGLQAMIAAMKPPSTRYLYFVAKDGKSGRTSFSENLKMHNQAVRKYRQSIRNSSK
ncbi:MAG: endolytic transglycosylase MltG [SAR324 cluster bacterium]|nr:endolytic transglycosylase MltG [SAR324 cluster bacterium]